MVGLRMVKEDKRFDDMLRRQGERRQLRTVTIFRNNDDNECRCNADDAMRKGNKNGVTSDDFRTLKPP